VNTLFTRTVLLSVAMLLAVHGGYRLLGQTPWFDADTESPVSVPVRDTYAASFGDTAGIRPALSIRPRIVDLDQPVVSRLASFVWLPAPRAGAGDLAALDDTAQEPAADPRAAPLLLTLPAVLIALCLYWLRQTRRSLHAVARMARESGTSVPCSIPAAALKAGTGDVRRLAGTFSDLMRRQSRALDDQSAALDAFSRYIDVLVARLRARALQVSHWHKRVAFIEDIDLFSNVARQFVDVAGRGAANAADVSVDAYLRDRFFHGATMGDAKIVLALSAGADFMLPRAALERLIGNLVGNALAHGAPPVEIATSRGARTWTLSVRDHGTGIHDRDLAAVLQPFVRVPSADLHHASDQQERHWGLGLAIVGRLAQSCGAKLKLGNHPGGGLWVRVIVPAR
jgi:two-component system osmolarity sensor histidine kinase EnvZ